MHHEQFAWMDAGNIHTRRPRRCFAVARTSVFERETATLLRTSASQEIQIMKRDALNAEATRDALLSCGAAFLKRPSGRHSGDAL